MVLSHFGIGTIWYFMVLSDFGIGTIWYFMVLSDFCIGTIGILWYFLILALGLFGILWYSHILAVFSILCNFQIFSRQWYYMVFYGTFRFWSWYFFGTLWYFSAKTIH